MIRQPGVNSHNPIRLRRFVAALAIGWTACVAGSLFWNLHQTEREILEVALAAARSNIDKDLLFRHWNASHGGVYVPITETTPPNPYLEVVERDITTPSGRALTLVNPAYMTRQLHEMAKTETQADSHLTSLNPLNPANAADPWERAALQRLHRGEPEVSSMETGAGKAVLRLLRPMRVEEACLKCHARQGYRLGEVRGGISVSVPMANLLVIYAPRISTLWLGHGLLWLTGLTGLGLGNRRLSAQIREWERTEQALMESEKRFRSIFENAGAGMNTITLEGRFLQTNNAFREFIGYSEDELQTRTVFDLTAPEDRERTRHLFDDVRQGRKTTFNYEKRFLRKDGEAVWGAVTTAWQFDAHGTPLHAVGLVQDITELRALENQLRHAQKMEAIGTLTAGIAHDFNNILTAIVGHASLLEMKMDAAQPLRSHVLQILTAADHATRMTGSLLTFSRKQPFEPRLLDLNEQVERSGQLLARLIPADIELRITPDAAAVTIMADGGQLEQALMNLVTNARDAMPQGGALSIRVRRVELDATFVQAHGFGIPGSYALIEVSDTGSGMDETTRQRVFEPFFTTKAIGKGTGLGLAIAYGIVKQHAGYINCYSEPGKGTTFRLYLPVIAEKICELSPR
jgi:PAS domain S-box-containing protein